MICFLDIFQKINKKNDKIPYKKAFILGGDIFYVFFLEN
jgi:hypothetical protein